MHYASVTCTPLSHLHGIVGLVLVLLRLNVPVNNFSVMSGRSHLFLGITSTFLGGKCVFAQGHSTAEVGIDPPDLSLRGPNL